MTKAEDKEKGNLTITVNYIKFAQIIDAAIHFLQKVRADLEVAAVKKEREDLNE